VLRELWMGEAEARIPRRIRISTYPKEKERTLGTVKRGSYR